MTDRTAMRRIAVLMATVFVDMIGFLIVLPLLPYYGERFGATETTIGLLISVFAFAQLASAPLWGRLSDRWGRRPVILGSLLVSAVAFVTFGLAESVWPLFLSRLIQGVGGGTTGVVQAYVSDSVGPEQRTRALGWLTAATSAGVMLGPLLGSAAAAVGASLPGFLAAGLCLANFAFAWKLLPESIGGRDEETAGAAVDGAPAPPPAPRTSLAQAILRVLAHPASERSRLVWVYALGMMAFMAMNGVIVLYLDRAFGVSEHQIGWFYTYVGGVSLLMRALLLGPINHRLGDVKTMRVGALALALGLALAPVPRSFLGLGLVILLVPVGTALLFPATTSLVSRLSERRETGQNLGVQQGFGGVARMVGPIWSTAVFQHVGLAAPFWMAAGLMGLVILVSFGVHPPPRPARPGQPPPAEAAPPVEPS
ncbi:MAG TPA: MFS transporter [Thermoanaerobaculia bacterium]|nr:MFS transporter [Thermoanaerobaculia bacterium]